MSERIAIIAALAREVSPFLETPAFRRASAARMRAEVPGQVEAHGNLEVPGQVEAPGNLEAPGQVEAHGFSRVNRAGRNGGALAPALKAFRSGENLLIIGGMGCVAATRAARAALEFHRPTLLVSAGFAGALTPHLAVADVIIPGRIIDANTGRAFARGWPTLLSPDFGERGWGTRETTLVTSSSVLSRDAKSPLAARFSAHAVDMEAAAVAAVAENAGLPFLAVKAISDPFDLEMPPLDRFLDSAGTLNLLELLVYAAPRPRLWGVLDQLRRNTARAAQALAGALAKLQARDPVPAG